LWGPKPREFFWSSKPFIDPTYNNITGLVGARPCKENRLTSISKKQKLACFGWGLMQTVCKLFHEGYGIQVWFTISIGFQASIHCWFVRSKFQASLQIRV
jgi:hypothetical protein